MQGIITGIGFLGAGEIVTRSFDHSDGIQVKGLTSAAAIWVSASLGVAVACGLWKIALLGAILTFIILRAVKKIELRSGRSEDLREEG
jgi:putative Mg2+ transporter-C (MgtC) family protein